MTVTSMILILRAGKSAAECPITGVRGVRPVLASMIDVASTTGPSRPDVARPLVLTAKPVRFVNKKRREIDPPRSTPPLPGADKIP